MSVSCILDEIVVSQCVIPMQNHAGKEELISPLLCMRESNRIVEVDESDLSLRLEMI